MQALSRELSEWISQFTAVDIWGIALAVVVTVVALAIVRFALPRVLRSVSVRTDDEGVPLAWDHLARPLTLIIVLLGLWAVAVQIPVPERLQETYGRALSIALSVLITLLVTYAVLRVLNAIGTRYAERLTQDHDPRAVYAGAIRKIASIGLMSVAFLVVLGQLGYEIGPLLASLGVAGIAVALALQDTLGNLFAGFYLTFDQPIRPGDYIQLDSGEEGFVEAIGWRNTRIRPWNNNNIIIPNSKLSEATITNWHQPVPEMSVYVWCGVDYGSDLDRVEKVCIEVGKEVMARVEGSAPDWTPIVRFKEFGDSNITFVVVLRVSDPTVIYVMQHEYVKALHKRFKQAGVEISWPVTKVVFPGGAPTGTPPTTL